MTPEQIAALKAERDALAEEADCHDEEIRRWEEQSEIDRKTITALEEERDALKAENQKMVTLLGHIHPDPDYEAVQEYHAFFEARRALEASK